MGTRTTAWSYSSLKTFEQCPKKYYHLKVIRDYDEDFNTEAILYGNEYHMAAEQYVSGLVDELDPRFDYSQNVLDKLLAMPGEKLCEYKMGITSNLEPCEFFADDVWYRGVADLIILDRDTGIARVFDYKTGKSAKYADVGQLELMALCVFKHFPEVHTVKAGLLFVVCNKLVKETYERKDESELWKKWLTKHGILEKTFATDVWNPRPTGLCKAHCIILECPHNGRR